MIPTHDVDPHVDVDYEHLRVPSAYEVIHGFAVVRDYEPLVDVSWEEARECVEAEGRWLDRAAAATDEAGFEAVLESAPEEESPEDFDYLFRYLDVGVAGLALVLAAADFATCTSCRGHPGRVSETVPQVGMAADPERVRMLADLALPAGCGVASDDGLVWVFGASVVQTHRLAVQLLEARPTFAALPPAPWRARVDQAWAANAGEDFEWDDDEM